jgi:CubicO group peptidase (beta-lactamase class C family)
MARTGKRSFAGRTFRGFLWFLLAIVVSLNLFIVLSGRFYLYKGVWHTYLHGESSPTIYDKDKFFSSTLKAAAAKEPWKMHPDKNSVGLTAEEEKYIGNLGGRSFLVFRGDSLIFERYWDKHDERTVSNSFSAAKTVIGLLIGVAIEEGKIHSLDDRASQYLTEFTGNGKEIITIRQLLMMASGLDWVESAKDPLSENAESYYGSDLMGLVLRQKRVRQPGKEFIYQSGNSQILGFVLEKATGRDLTEYADEKLWRPMGAENDAFWSLDRENGNEKAFCCLYSTSRDFARLGRLINHFGNWNGKQLVPEWYMKEMVKNPVMTTEEGVPNLRYGLHIWTYTDDSQPVYYCRGIHGQYIISIPSRDLVIVRTGKRRADNLTVPEGKKNDTAYLKAHEAQLGHPADLFEYLKIGKRIAAKVR